jgi:AcrR family transcriptional regulator
LEESQRTRILAAAAELVAEQGFGAVTATNIVRRAGVSRRSFYELFGDREACLLAAFDEGVARAAARMAPAYTGETRWRDGIRAALAAFLRFLEEEPAFARLCVARAVCGGEPILRRRAEVLSVLWEVVDRGRLQSTTAREGPSRVVAEGVVGAVLTIVQNRLQDRDRRASTMELFGPLMSLILLPYLGSGAARRELTRPAPRAPASIGSIGDQEDALVDPGVRLTYRTARVLAAIAEYPGASNREVAERAGVVDQGQISKLLARLDNQGLVANMSSGTSRGAPNAWRLTERGEWVERAAEREALRSAG